MDIEDWTSGEELTALLAAVTAVFEALPGQLHRLTGPDLDAALSAVDRVAAVAAGTRFTLTAEAVARGEVASSQAGSVAQWVADRCPALDGREAGLVGKAVRELTAPRVAPELVVARDAVTAGRLSVPATCVVATELKQLIPLVESSALGAVTAGLVAMGEVDGAVGVRRVRSALLGRYGLGEVLQEMEDRHRGLTVLSCGHDIGGGITEYRLRLNPEARAVVEAAINAASAPRPTDDPDPRTVDQRRGDALVDVCRRAVAVAGSAGAVPAGVKATVVVTIQAEDLQSRDRPGVLVGGLDAGSLLGPETVRRLACDAAVIPAVLHGDSHVLHWGRTKRLFTPAQTKALWLRDRHCTFPGCQTPASWCDAHHVTHWIDGGPTDLENAALLCARHHTVVHRDRLAAAVTTIGVEWDRRAGSYDRALARGPSPPRRHSA